MKVYEFGVENAKTFAMFQCAAEPWWAFRASAEAMARDYHVFLFIADGHDEQGTEFVSIEKNVKNAADYLRKAGVSLVDAMYGEEEKKARKNDLAYTRRVYPQTVEREFKGLAHAELVLMFPERFYREVTRFSDD